MSEMDDMSKSFNFIAIQCIIDQNILFGVIILILNMHYRSNQNIYLPSHPLKQISTKHITLNHLPERHTSSAQTQLQFYKTQINNLRIKCAKIDQIEKYANILLQSVQHNKLQHQQMQEQHLEQLALIEQLRTQILLLEGQLHNREETKRLDALRDMEKKKQQIEDTFSSIKWQQELLNERQNKEKMLASMENKYKAELNNLEQKLLSADAAMQQQLLVWKRAADLADKQNDVLRTSIQELQSSMQELQRGFKTNGQQTQSLAHQLQKTMTSKQMLQEELSHREEVIKQKDEVIRQRDELITQVQNDSLKTIDALDSQLDTLKIQKQKLANDKLNLQRSNQKLKSQGAILISQNKAIKDKIVQLQEIRYQNGRLIESLQLEIAQLTQSHTIIQSNLIETQNNYKQLSAALQRDNIELLRSNQLMSAEIITKQKEIEDLIAIVSNMENSTKIIESSAIKYEQVNFKLNNRVRQLEDATQRQTSELTHLRNRINQAEKYAGESQRNLLQSKPKLIELENARQMIQEYEQLIRQESEKIKQLQSKNERSLTQIAQLQKQIAQFQRLTFEGRDDLALIQSKYGKEKQKNQAHQKQIQRLQQQIRQQQNKISQLQYQLHQQQQKFEQQKQSITEQALQKMQKLMSQKYEQILKQKDQHFKNKIAYLESEIELLKNQEVEFEQVPQE